ncbi:2-oxo acid dehydrogenase subunit E2 [Aeromicrobium sp.]|uniref:2-oxo acid dehydrogenase subunit E2 n=1 Tax=Aeromicrobium sp. TaxID=1871063 RepID=UPI0019AF7D92|nr:2-oxo acid dehydrogenase subunit E2 [Aeromicrobium sp.]MBC7632697.1 2-oxo acid dehydrogenase subunit E2 [Aeromicrobium sp.]
MAQEVLLPKLGLTMEEGTIIEWVAQSGDVVKTGDILLRLATDKVDVEIEAEGDGRFEPVVPEGATLPPGAVIAWLLSGDERAPTGSVVTAAVALPAAPVATVGDGDELRDLDPAAGASPERQGNGRLLASPNAKRIAGDVGINLTVLRGSGPGGRIVSEDVEEEIARQRAAPSVNSPVPGQFVSPLVRRHASVSGVDLSTVRGTGLSGRIRRADVEAAAAMLAAPAVAAPAPAAPAPAAPTGPRAGQVVPLTGMRGAIARNMHASLQEMAQLTHGYEAEVGGLLALRERLKVEWAGSGVNVPTINDFVIRAVGHALVEHPMLNATIRDGAIYLLEQVNVGVAVAVSDGLVVPVVRDADRQPLASIAAQTRALATAARNGTLTLSQLEGATFVVSSLGSYGVDFFTPVVNPGNTGILGVGRVRDGVRWEGDVPHRTSVLTLSLSFDHRAVDGAPAAQFLRSVSGLLARPLLLLAG